MGRMPPAKICKCYIDYPNPGHKYKNGHWKCVDEYTCVQNALGEYKVKTICIRKESFDYGKK